MWALGTVDVQHHGHRIAPSIVKEGFEGFDVSIERRSALNQLHIFHTCLCLIIIIIVIQEQSVLVSECSSAVIRRFTPTYIDIIA